MAGWMLHAEAKPSALRDSLADAKRETAKGAKADGGPGLDEGVPEQMDAAIVAAAAVAKLFKGNRQVTATVSGTSHDESVAVTVSVSQPSA